jgi:hypothetical protein
MAARKAIQSNPGFTMCYIQLAAALVKLGCLEEAKAAGARALELQSTFRCSEQFAGCDHRDVSSYPASTLAFIVIIMREVLLPARIWLDARCGCRVPHRWLA